MNTPPDLLSLFAAQFREWWPYTRDFFADVWSFLSGNEYWIELGFILASAVLLIGVIIFAKLASREFKEYKGLTLRDLLGFGSKKPVEYFKEWKRIEKDLKSKKEERMKRAVIGARQLFDNLLHESAYKGNTFHDRIRSFISDFGFEKEEELLEAEEIGKKLKGGEKEDITYSQASQAIEIYEEAIDEVYEVRI